MNTLTSENRNRHSLAMRNILNNAFSISGGFTKVNLNTGEPMIGAYNSSWPYGPVRARLGSRRSADGFVFDLPNYTAPDGGKVVLKVIFSNDDNPKSEISIGKLAGNHGIGPKIYAAYRLMAPTGQRIFNIMQSKGHLLNGYVNLFQQYRQRNIRTKRFRFIYLIIMENLYSNPARHVVGAKELENAFKNRSYHIPIKKLMGLRKKLQGFGVIHADMHLGNIIIQKVQVGSRTYYKPVIIDYGRSLRVPRSFSSNQNVNQYIRTNLGARNLPAGDPYSNSHLMLSTGNYIRTNSSTTRNISRMYHARLANRRAHVRGGTAASLASMMRENTPLASASPMNTSNRRASPMNRRRVSPRSNISAIGRISLSKKEPIMKALGNILVSPKQIKAYLTMKKTLRKKISKTRRQRRPIRRPN